VFSAPISDIRNPAPETLFATSTLRLLFVILFLVEVCMKYSRFEELLVWQAVQLAVQIYSLTAQAIFKGHYSLKDQIERDGLSISNNIAEGFERGTTQEVLTFLYIARGSAGEVRSILCVLERLERFKDLKFQISNLKSRSEEISRQLRSWAGSLQNSEIRGQRYLTNKGKNKAQAAREREEFLKELEEIRNRGAEREE
jgi:four helix bundle protein